MYNHNLIEKKWQKYWKDNKTFAFKNNDEKKFYVLDMFPYPSGNGLHVGHPKGYTSTDIISRYKRLCGYDVLHPMGWDAFGLPAEQYAMQTGNHPKSFTEKNIQNFKNQLIALGFDFDFDKEVNTTDPKYYKWTQWIFSKLFENGLAELKDVNVNWCEKLGTVLSNEEVLQKDGKMVSERGEYDVIKKPMRQWVLKITKYADKLLKGLNEVDWPESLKSIQRNWIGKSEGTLINFPIENQNFKIEVFTTRPDTIFGVSYIAIAPESHLLNQLTSQNNINAVTKYVEQAKTKTELQRKELEKDKTGVFTGSYAINPISKQKLPIYVADYVLTDYGTGIVMGVPAHDERDWNFAKKYNLPIKFVIDCNDKNHPYTNNGKHINSDFLNGLNTKEATNKIIEILEKDNIGKKHITYKLRDWIFSRQRYWGEPFPIIFDDKNIPHLVNELPVTLPDVKEIKPSKNGESPLALITNWVNITIDGKHYHRDTNTMPQWAGSCWYYLGYLLKNNNEYIDLNSKEAFNLFKKWLPVDLYIGGQEHAVLHLLYARFWHHFLYDIGIVPTKEPFQKIINQGMILGENNEKMSKSRGNVVNPDEIVASHGADALRIYEMFMGPITASLPWKDTGLNGARKWLDRVYRLFMDEQIIINDQQNDNNFEKAYNKFVMSITNNINNYAFNLAISDMMVFINECYKQKSINKSYLNNFLIILSCFAPHLAEELWSIMKNNGSVCLQQWPKFDSSKITNDFVTLPIQINGKLRHTIQVEKDSQQEKVINLIMKEEKIINLLGNSKIKKTIFIPNKIVNFII